MCRRLPSLAKRLAAGTYATVLAGDIAHKFVSGGKFLVGDVAVEAPRGMRFRPSGTAVLTLGEARHPNRRTTRASSSLAAWNAS